LPHEQAQLASRVKTIRPRKIWRTTVRRRRRRGAGKHDEADPREAGWRGIRDKPRIWQHVVRRRPPIVELSAFAGNAWNAPFRGPHGTAEPLLPSPEPRPCSFPLPLLDVRRRPAPLRLGPSGQAAAQLVRPGYCRRDANTGSSVQSALAGIRRAAQFRLVRPGFELRPVFRGVASRTGFVQADCPQAAVRRRRRAIDSGAHRLAAVRGGPPAEA
jgi:hypothetical protein